MVKKKVVYKSFHPSYKAHPFFHLLVVLVLVSLIGIILYSLPIAKQISQSFNMQPTPVQTTNWKTYTNTTYQYSLRYPQGYSISSQTELGAGAQICVTDNKGYCIITVRSLPLGSLTMDKLLTRASCLYQPYTQLFNNNQWMFCETKDKSGLLSSYFLVKNNKYYEADIHINNPPTNPEQTILVTNIMKTFTIIGNDVIDTSLWKTYINPLGKFSIQYPPEWVIRELHYPSNAVLDDPEDINTAVLSGKEGEVVLQWGPMGFGGGCGNWKTQQLKNTTSEVCTYINSNGKDFWGGICAPANHDPAFCSRADAPSSSANEAIINKIYSTLSFY